MNITSHSLAICPTSLATALPSVKHHQSQHCHQRIAISILPFGQIHQNSII
jgi:hypothetical protein